MKRYYLLMALCMAGVMGMKAGMAAPTNVQASDITGSSATISWESDGVYFDVRYKLLEKGGTSYGFNTQAQFDEWTLWDLDEDGKNWTWSNNFSHWGQGCVYSESYDGSTKKALTPNNWLISPKTTLGHTVTLWARGRESNPEYAAEEFELYVLYSNSMIALPVSQTLVTTNEYRLYTVDISDYEGHEAQIAIRHTGSDKNKLYIDDVTIYSGDDYPGDADWTVKNVSGENSIALTGLRANASYAVQVKAKVNDEESDWSTEYVFQTAEDKEIYGVLSNDDEVFTLYYDGKREERGGMIFDNQIGWNGEGFDDKVGGVKKIVFDESLADARPTSTESWFHWFGAAEKLEHPENLNTSEVKSMESMFDHCYVLDSLDLSSWNTAKVEDMSSMFSYCQGLKSVNLTGWNTGKVKTMWCMFSYCSVLEKIDIRSFDVSSVTEMSHMFSDCKELTTIYCDQDWTQLAASGYYVFTGSTHLRGGRGFGYKEEYDNLTYARPDKSNEDGYFTASVVEDVLCQVTSEGWLDIPRAQLTVWDFGNAGKWGRLALFCAKDWFYGKDDKMYTYSANKALVLTIAAPSVTYLVGSYSVAQGNLMSAPYIIHEGEGVYKQKVPDDISFTITLNEAQNAYNLEYSLTFEGDGTYTGKVYNICADVIDGIGNVQGGKEQSTKVLKDGILLIERAGKLYNALGTEVR